MAASSHNRKKTLWEKEELLFPSNSSFSHSVFKRLVLQTCENQGLFGKGLMHLLVLKLVLVTSGENSVTISRQGAFGLYSSPLPIALDNYYDYRRH